MSFKLGEKTVRISFLFAVFFAVAANFTGGKNVLLSFFFALVHEGVHIVFLHIAGVKRADVVLLPAAVKISCEGLNLLSYKKTFLCTMCAPVFNIVTGAVFALLYCIFSWENLKICAAVNLVPGIINLLPMEFLDGGRAMKAFLSQKYDEEKVRFVMKKLSPVSLIFLFSAFFIGCILGKIQVFLLIFCVYCLVGSFSDK